MDFLRSRQNLQSHLLGRLLKALLQPITFTEKPFRPRPCHRHPRKRVLLPDYFHPWTNGGRLDARDRCAPRGCLYPVASHGCHAHRPKEVVEQAWEKRFLEKLELLKKPLNDAIWPHPFPSLSKSPDYPRPSPLLLLPQTMGLRQSSQEGLFLTSRTNRDSSTTPHLQRA